MKKLWAPWRLSYIIHFHRKASLQKKSHCVFCNAHPGKPSSDNLVLFKGKKCFIIMNKYPYCNGHLMIIPKRHIFDFSKVTSEEHQEMGELLSLSTRVLKKVFHTKGFNIGMNLGEAGGAGIKDHLHYHVVPRWPGDHNYMPIIGHTKVMPEYIKETYERLRPHF